MKKKIVGILAFSMLCFSSLSGYAEESTGSAAVSGAETSKVAAWGLGLGIVAVVATVAIIVATNTSDSSAHVH
ncbi:MAG: hypothetical protein WCP39_07540 [Chlamydiota bacterium]